MTARGALLGLVLLAGCADSGVQPLGEARLPAWACPAAGTTVAWEATGGRSGTAVSDGARADDPETCVWRDNGGVEALAFSLRDLSAATMTTEERVGFSTAMRGLFGGGQTVAAFTDRRRGQQLTHQIRVVGRETLVIGGQSVPTVKIRLRNTFSGNGNGWDFDRWFDPTRHVWVKSYDHSSLREWRAVSITGPGAADAAPTTPVSAGRAP